MSERKTNADRIRAMTDEELAERASVATFCTACPVKECHFLLNLDACRKMFLAWLRAPAESEGEP